MKRNELSEAVTHLAIEADLILEDVIDTMAKEEPKESTIKFLREWQAELEQQHNICMHCAECVEDLDLIEKLELIWEVLDSADAKRAVHLDRFCNFEA